jgi:hypothetical protein
MNARYLTDYSGHSLSEYLQRRHGWRLPGNGLNLKPLFESIGWVLAGAVVGSAAVMLGAWGLLQLTERNSADHTAMIYQVPHQQQPH